MKIRMRIKISGAIFDMDGTLINSLIVWDMIWEEFGRRFCGGKKFEPSKEDDKAIRTIPLKDAMELLHKRYGIGNDGKELLDVADEVCTEFYSSQVELKEGTREFLERARARGIKMCVATATAIAPIGAFEGKIQFVEQGSPFQRFVRVIKGMKALTRRENHGQRVSG